MKKSKIDLDLKSTFFIIILLLLKYVQGLTLVSYQHTFIRDGTTYAII